MFNNRGQSLALFVITLPVLLIVLVLVIDIGRVISLKQELNNISELVLDYGLDYFNDVNIDINDNVNGMSIDNGVIDIEDKLIEKLVQ